MIRHTVAFKLRHPEGSLTERDFLAAACKLRSIPTVKNFELLRQVSAKNSYTFGLSMEFTSQSEYLAYATHPDHSKFVSERWIPEVVEFIEIDYEPLDHVAQTFLSVDAAGAAMDSGGRPDGHL